MENICYSKTKGTAICMFGVHTILDHQVLSGWRIHLLAMHDMLPLMMTPQPLTACMAIGGFCR